MTLPHISRGFFRQIKSGMPFRVPKPGAEPGAHVLQTQAPGSRHQEPEVPYDISLALSGDRYSDRSLNRGPGRHVMWASGDATPGREPEKIIFRGGASVVWGVEQVAAPIFALDTPIYLGPRKSNARFRALRASGGPSEAGRRFPAPNNPQRHPDATHIGPV
jgi:hypothetical protein